jgi:hypothetical protein
MHPCPGQDPDDFQVRYLWVLWTRTLRVEEPVTFRNFVSTLIALAVGIYAVHGAFTQTGVVGWLIYFEDTLVGGHYPAFSALLTFVLLAAPAMIGWNLLSGMVSLGRDTGFTQRLLFRGFAKGQADPHRVTTNRELLIAWGILVVATWLIGYAVYAWWAHVQREDAAATYEPVTLSEGIAVPSLKGKHLALVGHPQTDLALVNSDGGSLQPVVPRGWTPGMPVTFVLKVERPSDLPGVARPRPFNLDKPAPPEPLLARVGGDVPVPATQEFKKMGVPLSEHSSLLRLVPSEGGKPVFGDSRDARPDDLLAERFTVFLYVCAGLSVLCTVIMAMAWAAAKRARKRA